MKNIDIVALGELLIDFTESGISKQGNPLLEANPGGAPCNVLSMLNKLGKKTSFIGKVGKDIFGKQLFDCLKKAGIGTDGLIMDPEWNTTLAFVHNEKDGQRDFSFYRKSGADVKLTFEEINRELLENCRIFHFGTLSMTADPAKEATHRALKIAKASGAVITFDPNIREPLWNSMDEARLMTDWGLAQCDMVKISDNEIQWFTGISDFDEAIDNLFTTYPNLKLILLSLGPDGSIAAAPGIKVREAAIINPDTVETTGAGDTFCACVINRILEKNIPENKNWIFEAEELKSMLIYANTAASIITTRYGALKVMPEKEEIEKALKKNL